MGGNNRELVILQDRDLRLFRELGVMRVIDREQAKTVAGFGSTTRANTRLLALARAGYLRRFFWGTIGGARKGMYALSARGADLAGVPYRRQRRGKDEVLAMDSHTAHQLEVNAIYCEVKHRPPPNDGTKFVRWMSFEEPLRGTAMIPDGYFELEAQGESHALFLEVDIGNEGRIVWERKIRAYLSYAASGSFAGQFGHPQFRTLAVTNSETRLNLLRKATAALTPKIFRFTTFERIKRDGFWSSIWQKPVGDERQTLL